MSQRYLELTYNAAGHLISVTNPASRSTHFGYQQVTNSEGVTLSLLTTITDTRNQPWRYDYTEIEPLTPQASIFVLSKVTDPDDRIVEQTEFDRQGRAISQTFRGEYVGIEYFDDGQRIIEDGLGRTITHTYNSLYRLLQTENAEGERQSQSYDALGNRLSSADAENIVTRFEYTLDFTTTGTYHVWVRGYAPNAAGDSLYISLDGQTPTTLTGLPPQQWSWANSTLSGQRVTFEVTEAREHTLFLWMREDGLKIDRIVLTVDDTYNPQGNGPAESPRLGDN